MVNFGYHASQEQFTPFDLVAYAIAAERHGFDCVMSSDHLAPWSTSQGQSAFVWAWLGAAMAKTSVPFGTMAIPGGWRYHPVIVAQAAATIGNLYPGRLSWLGMGSGQALSEGMLTAHWPDKAERNERLLAGVQMIRRLWSGDTIDQEAPFTACRAQLYCAAAAPPAVFGAALSPATASWLGAWADGLITVNQPPEQLNDIVAAFRAGGGDGKPMAIQVHVSFASNDSLARANAFDQWRSNTLAAPLAETLRCPSQFAAATCDITPDMLDAHVHISADPATQCAWLQRYIDMGFNEIYLHNVGRNQYEFIEAFQTAIKPRLDLHQDARRAA